MKKPHVRFCQLTHQFECGMWHTIPGERCLVAGYGETPAKAYDEYLWVKFKFHINQITVTKIMRPMVAVPPITWQQKLIEITC